MYVRRFQTLVFFVLLGTFGGWFAALAFGYWTGLSGTGVNAGVAVGALGGVLFWHLKRPGRSLNDRAGR